MNKMILAAFVTYCVSCGLGAIQPLAMASDPVLTITNPGSSRCFGCSVGSFGDQILVGAEFSDIDAPSAGIAYLFQSDGELVATFRNPEPDRFGSFGSSLLEFGNQVAIGTATSNNLDSEFEHDGVVFHFDPVSGQQIRATLNPDGVTREPRHHLIKLAELNGDLVVGYETATFGLARRYDGDTGDVVATYRNPTDPSANDVFGGPVAAFGDDVIVGAWREGNRDVGVAYLFDGETGDLLRTFANPEPTQSGQFARSIEVFGDLVAFGSPYGGSNDTAQGRVHVFNATNGELVTTMVDPDSGFRSFGLEMTSVGQLLAVGNFNFPDRSDVRIYNPTTGALVQTIASDVNLSGSLGSVSGNLIVGNSQWMNDDGSRGAVFVYDIVPEPQSLTLGLLACVFALNWRARQRKQSKP